MVRLFAATRIDPITRCWIFQGSVDTSGYGLISVDGTTWKAHRYAFHCMVADIDEEDLICHRCDVKLCCNPFHLFAGDQFDNMGDASLKGRKVALRGIENGHARLTEAEVLLIRSDRRTQLEIAAQYQIAQTTVSAIKARRTWAHLENSPAAISLSDQGEST